jgi:hypothetical protein
MGGSEALQDQLPHPSRNWNRIPYSIRQRIVELANLARQGLFGRS